MSLLACSALLGACVPQSIQFKPLRVEPIHMTVDVNIHEEAKADKTDGAGSEDTAK